MDIVEVDHSYDVSLIETSLQSFHGYVQVRRSAAALVLEELSYSA